MMTRKTEIIGASLLGAVMSLTDQGRGQLPRITGWSHINPIGGFGAPPYARIGRGFKEVDGGVVNPPGTKAAKAARKGKIGVTRRGY